MEIVYKFIISIKTKCDPSYRFPIEDMRCQLTLILLVKCDPTFRFQIEYKRCQVIDLVK